MPDPEADAFDPRAFHAKHKLAIIVACAENGVIGSGGDLPWHLPEDLRHFMRSTRGCSVVMGRKTFESLDRPLPNRLNIVLSRTMSGDRADGVLVAHDLDSAIGLARDAQTAPPVWIAGGGDVYLQSIDRADLVVLTRVHARIEGDTVFPDLAPSDWVLAHAIGFAADARHAHAMTIEWWVRR